MRKVWTILRREYIYNFRRRAYLFSAFGVPLFSIGMMFIIITITEAQVTATGQLGDIGYIDQAAILTEALEQPEEFRPFLDVEAAHQALLSEDIGAYFVIEEDFMATGNVDAYTFESVPEGIQDQFDDFVAENLAVLVTDSESMDRVRSPMVLELIDMRTGEVIEGEAAFIGGLMLPFFFGFIFLMAVTTTSQFLMSNVVEEKENRMMEILVTSCRPIQMLWGKILGLGALGLTQVIIWLGGGLVMLQFQDSIEFLSAVDIEPGFLVLALVYFILGYLLFGAVMAGIGASVTADQEARQIASIFTLASVLPMMFLVTFMQDPNGTLPVILSLLPITAPIAMLMRLPMTVVPVWQVGLSLTLLFITAVVTVWLAARIFRIGLLMYGKRLSLREVLNAVRRGQQTQLTMAQEDVA